MKGGGGGVGQVKGRALAVSDGGSGWVTRAEEGPGLLHAAMDEARHT